LSRLNDLIRQVGLKDETLAADLQREVAALADRRWFGLNFERHVPEVVELPGRPVRRGDKVRILPPRGQMPRKADEKFDNHAGEAPEDVLERLHDLAAPLHGGQRAAGR
jgi:adenine-specific DNA-methyltransferase